MKKLILLFLFMMALPLAFAASVSVTADKTSVQLGGQIILTYHQPEKSSYGIIQNIPAGWTAPGMATDRKVRIYTDSGDDTTLILTAPSSAATSSITGQYFVYPSVSYANLNSLTIQVGSGSTQQPSETQAESNGTSPLIFIIIILAAIAIFYFIKNKK